jgi:hypothetical protein
LLTWIPHNSFPPHLPYFLLSSSPLFLLPKF